MLRPVVGQTAKVGVIASEIVPAVAPTMAFLYEAANDQSSNHPAGIFNVLLAAGEGYLNQGVIRKARDLFVYIPLASGAYEMGRAKGAREKIFEIMRTGILFSAGYLGMTNLGFGICNALQLSEAEQTLNSIKKVPLEGLKALPENYQQLIQKLGVAAERQKKVLDFYRLHPSKVLPEKALDSALIKLSKAQKNLLKFMPQIRETILPKLPELSRDTLNHLLVLTNSYQARYVKILRGLNPLFGYFVGTALIASPIIGVLKNIMLPEGETTERIGKLVTPLWAENALNLLGMNPSSWGKASDKSLTFGQTF